MSRPLTDIPNGATVMLDANVLVYALTPQAQLHAACRDLLERWARGSMSLFANVSVTADVLHRAIVLEVLGQGQAQRAADAVALIKQGPDLVAQLTRYRTILRDLRQARVGILSLTYPGLHASRVFREQHGLVVNDSLVVAVMQHERLDVLATNDPGFARVPELAVRIPTP